MYIKYKMTKHYSEKFPIVFFFLILVKVTDSCAKSQKKLITKISQIS
jgi:hypothetical protein